MGKYANPKIAFFLVRYTSTKYVVTQYNNAAAEEIKIAMVQGNVSIGIISNPEYKLDVTAAEAEWEETPVLTISPVVLWGVEFYRKN